MVREALACSFCRYSSDYNDRAARVGIWEAQTEPAWDYRAHRWDVALQDAPEGCPIKGNINREGERIYHAPWSPWYARTKVNEATGEKWFCSEGDALAAGWRAPLWGR